MADPYVGEIRMFGGNFAPAGWAFCWGQLVPIAENDTLFTLIGTTYGGDGQQTFGLPNLASRIPVHQGSGFVIGEMAGTETVTLTTQQIPVHNHAMLASSSAGTNSDPGSQVLATPVASIYETAPPSVVAMNAGALGPAGGSQPHDNMQPYLAVSFIISLYGIYPTQ